MKNYAPIALFVYTRLDTLEKTIEALKANYLAKDSELYVFSDAAKHNKDIDKVNSVRNFLKTITGFKKIEVFESETNKGLANSIINGVSYILKKFDSVIVLEDDLISTPNFLDFMNQSLNQYKNELKVFSISGYSFNLQMSSWYNNDTYFLNRGWSWGWATWRDRWNTIDWEIKDYNVFKSNIKEQKLFATGGSDLPAMLKKQMNGELDSWAIRWFYNQFKAKGLTLYPVKSKIFNNGFDERATHTKGSSKRYVPDMDVMNKREFKFTVVELTEEAQKRFQKKMGIVARIKSKIETLLGWR